VTIYVAALKKALFACNFVYQKSLKLNNELYLLTIFKTNIFFLKNLFFFVDASYFISLKYASFTGLCWFNYQLREGE